MLFEGKTTIILNWESILTNYKKYNKSSYLFYEYDQQFLENYCNKSVQINLFSNHLSICKEQVIKYCY